MTFFLPVPLFRNHGGILQDILAKHVAVVIDSDPDAEKNIINIRRKHCLKDALTKLAKPSFIPRRKLSVKFADDMGKSEGAVDLGGPTHEFLRLAIGEMFETSGMFGGEDKNKVVLPNSQG